MNNIFIFIPLQILPRTLKIMQQKKKKNRLLIQAHRCPILLALVVLFCLFPNENCPGQINAFHLPTPGCSEAIAAWLFYDETAASGGGLREWASRTQTAFLHKQQDEMRSWQRYGIHTTSSTNTACVLTLALQSHRLSTSSDHIWLIAYARNKHTESTELCTSRRICMLTTRNVSRLHLFRAACKATVTIKE